MTQIEVEMLKIVRATLVTAEGRLFDHIATTFRWLMATLFAANGGAIIATLDLHRPHRDSVALGLFAGGVLLSIVMGICSSFAAYRGNISIEKTRVSIEEALLTGGDFEGALSEFIARHKPNWKTWYPSYVGMASFACLMIGMLVLGQHLR